MLRKRIAIASAMVTATVFASPAYSVETINVPFTNPSTGTSDLYSGIVRVTVSGIGNSFAKELNDAFYRLPSGIVQNNGKYQLGFSTSPLFPEDGAFAAYLNVVGGRPAFSADGIYSFLLNTGSAVPTRLYFGVTDGNFADNGGAFSISLSAVPESTTWALMILGMGAIGGAMRRRSAVKTAVRFS